MTLQLPIPPTDDLDFCRYSICWPDDPTWRYILVGFITQMQRGRTWDAATGSILDVQAVGQEITELNLPLQEVILACGDVSELADAIRSLSVGGGAGTGCCEFTGTGGTGSMDDPQDPQGTVDNGEPPPPGFNDWPSYDAFKCNVATKIIDDIIQDIGQISNVQLLGITVLGLAAVLIPLILTPLPFDEIVALAGVLIATLAFGAGLITDAQNILINNRDDFICALYDSSNTASAQQMYSDEVNSKVDAAHPGQPANWVIKSILEAWNSASNFNRLVGPTFPTQLPVGDCSGCGAQAWWDCLFGNVVTFDELSVEIDAVQAGDGMYLVSIGQSMQIFNPSASQTGWTPPSVAPNFASAYDQTEHLCASGGGAPWQVTSASFLTSFPSPMDTMLWRSQTPMTVTVTRTLTP